MKAYSVRDEKIVVQEPEVINEDMTQYIPKEIDNPYYEGSLRKNEDRVKLSGFDNCEEAIKNALENAMYDFDRDDIEEDVTVSRKDCAIIVKAFGEWLLDFVENERNLMVTNMLDRKEEE